MKSLAAILVLVLFSCFVMKAQKPIKVTEDSLKIGKSNLPSLSVVIPEASYEKVMKAWKKELESVSKTKTVEDNNNVTMYGAKLKSVSPDPVNVYSKLTPVDSATNLTVAFEQKKDEYIDKSQGLSFTKAKEYLKNFARDQYLDVVKDQSDAEEKKLRDLQKELSSLEKEKSKLQKTIASDSADLFTEDENIKIQKNELSTVSAAIVDQNKKMSSPDADAMKKENEKYLNDLDKRKKKALNSIESSQNKIAKMKNEIAKSKEEIPRNEQQQQEIQEKIDAQQKVANTYAEKVKTIESY
jgi:hypothetical protein